jgi:UDP-N-acetylglucosamine transferase subunit ALG13
VIFLTVGTQLSFDRLVSVVDKWCGNNPDITVFAQVGLTTLKIEHMEYAEFVTPEQANKFFLDADLIIAHAGMGSVLTALKYRKPILIAPRKASLGEHRNEHQLATAKWLSGHPGISVAFDESQVTAFLDNQTTFQAGAEISDYASPELIKRLNNFILK